MELTTAIFYIQGPQMNHSAASTDVYLWADFIKVMRNVMGLKKLKNLSRPCKRQGMSTSEFSDYEENDLVPINESKDEADEST